jgi:hypothetical protein
MIRKLLNKCVETPDSYSTSRSYWDILYTNLFNFFHIILFIVGAILIAFGRYNDAFITNRGSSFSAS